VELQSLILELTSIVGAAGADAIDRRLETLDDASVLASDATAVPAIAPGSLMSC